MTSQSLAILSVMDELQRIMANVPDLTVLDAYARETECARSSNYGEASSPTPVLLAPKVGRIGDGDGDEGEGALSTEDSNGFDMLSMFKMAEALPGANNSARPSDDREEPSSLSNSFSGKALMRRSAVTNHKKLDELETADEDESANVESFSFGDFVMGSTTIDESPVARVKPKSENAFMFGDFFVDDVPMEQFRTNRKPSSNSEGSPSSPSKKKKAVARPKIATGTAIQDFHLHHLRSHPNRIRSCVIASQRDNCIVSCGEKDGYPRMMAEYGEHPLQLYLGHQSDVLHVAISADCGTIATSGMDGFLLIFEVSTGIKSGDARHPCPVRCSSFSKNGKFIVTGAEDGNCRLWASKKKNQSTAMSSYFRQKGNTTCISFQPTGDLIASGSSDTSVHVWSGSTAKLSFTVQEKHLGSVASVGFNGAGDRLLSADPLRVVVSDCTSGLPIFSIDSDVFSPTLRPGKGSVAGGPRFTFSAVSFGPASIPNLVVICGSDKRVMLHELVVAEEQPSAAGASRSPMTPKSPTGQKLKVPKLSLSPEVWSYMAKGPVVCVNAGANKAVALGDLNGNVTLLAMDPRPGSKDPPLLLYKQAKQLAAKRKDKSKPA